MKPGKPLGPVLEGLMRHAMAEHKAGRWRQAETIYRQVLADVPGNPSALNLLGAMLMDQGKDEEALGYLRKAVMNAPAYEAAQTNFGSVLYKLHTAGKREIAHREARAWSKRQPKNEIARHWAKSLGAALPESAQGQENRMPDVLVRNAFDGFADKFDAKLAKLDYRAPGLLAQMLAPRLKGREGSLAVLDAGCGTGLMAPHLKPWASRLEGADLSERMLEKASQRGLYDHLEAAELTAFLAQRPGAYDLIAAADVLCYFGSLEQVLGKASLALRPQGLIAFTVEAAEQGAFTLQATGRYAHAEAYLRACLEGAGLSLLELKQDHARTEAGKPVPCFAVAAERRTD